MTPSLAAITLDPRGGGIAAVSRLLWRVMTDEWGPDCALITLVPSGARSFDTATLERLVFGARVGWTQMARRSTWTLYSHLAIARAQTFLPDRLRRPYGVFLHGIEAWRPLSADQARVLEEASVLLANSEYTAGRIRAAHPWMPAMTVCALTVESVPDAPSDGVADRAWGSEAVVVVGRMSAAERYKGHDELLAAWPRVLLARPAARLVFIGEGDDRSRLEAKARDLGIASSLVTTGFLSDVELDRAYRRAAVFAMPSRNEGFGLVYLEAMLRQLPCIGSRFDAAAEIIEDGATGFLVDQAHADALADRIIELLTDPCRALAMGERGRKRAMGQFGYDQFSGRVRAALEGLSGARLTTASVASSLTD
jgi:phosphatidylinositol alpha-1,6-mannosyltransferase